MSFPSQTAAPCDDNAEPLAAAAHTYANRLRRRIVRRATALAIATFLAACSLFAPWHGVADRGIGDALGCVSIDDGCRGSGAATYTDHRGVDDVDTWPALILFAVAGLATWAALTANRRVQKRAGVCAIVTSLLVGPYVLIAATIMAHFLTATVSRGGDYAFFALMLATLVAGIINVRDPSPDPGLPRAQASIRGMAAPSTVTEIRS